MQEIKWRDIFPNQDKKIQHINRFVLLLSMCKMLIRNTRTVESNAESLDVQDFSVYVDYLKKYVLPYEARRKSKLLQNQEPFRSFVNDISSEKTLKIPYSEKQMIYEKFTEYVNLKDWKLQYKAYRIGVYSFFPTIILGISVAVFVVTNKTFPYYLGSFFSISLLCTLYGVLRYLLFGGRFKNYWVNLYRINSNRCLEALQTELEYLESEDGLGRSSDPYENMSYTKCCRIFSEQYPVTADFIEKLQTLKFPDPKYKVEKVILDENNVLTPCFNHLFIQYLKKIRIAKQGDFDWQLISHILKIDISKSRKADFLKEEFKVDTIYDTQFKDFCSLLDTNCLKK